MPDRVFWLVGAGSGALPHGEFVPTACERWIRLPYSTPYDRVPASSAIRDRCAECADVLVPLGLVEVTGDS